MTLKGGKFYNENGDHVPIEHGNKEQIKLLEKAKALNDGVGIIYYVTFHADKEQIYHCLCGEKWPATAHPVEKDKVNKKCPCCGLNYVIYWSEELPLILIRLK